MDELLNTQIDSLGLILRFEQNLKKASKKNMTKGFLMDRLELLKEYWKQSYQDHLRLLSYEDIESTEFIKDDVFAEVELQYSLMLSQLNDWLEELDETYSESPAISIDTHVNCQSQGLRKPEIKVKVDSKEDELGYREWSKAKATIIHRRKRNQKSD